MEGSKDGIMWAIVSSFWISLMLCGVRYISVDYNSFVIVFWRSLFSLIFMFPWVLKHRIQAIKTDKTKQIAGLNRYIIFPSQSQNQNLYVFDLWLM